MVDERELIQIESYNYLKIFEEEESTIVQIDNSHEAEIVEVYLGTKGERGDQVEIRSNNLMLQSKYSNEVAWTDIFDLSELQGEDGKSIEMQATATHLQWRFVGDLTWVDLISFQYLADNFGYIHPNTHPVSMIVEDENRVFLTNQEKIDLLDTHSKREYIHNQILSSATWVITHNLNRFPSISIIDTGGNLVFGDVLYLSSDIIQVSFNGAFSGKAYLN